MHSNFKSEILTFLLLLSKEAGLHLIEIAGPDDDFLYIPKIDRAIIFHSIGLATHDERTALHHLHIDGRHIPVVHLWEDQWQYHTAKVKSRLRSMLGLSVKIHGRQTRVVELRNDELLHFLKQNHMHVPIRAKYKYGLMKGDQLVAVMSFGKALYMHRENVPFESFELLRFCNALNLTVVGGFSKLLSHFVGLASPEHIMSYIDADWSEGHAFAAVGFRQVDTLPEMELWLNQKTGEREYPHMVMKTHEKPDSMLSDPKALQLFLQAHGYARVYNSGSYKYTLRLR
ncbi:MAG: hypothetical protein HC819_02540 [Cyclobacteriaceae bacterium]|nr:hypothetical protein [Cyclobacteriaceae bacterium]